MVYTTKISCDKSNLKNVRDFVSGVLDNYRIPDVDINLVVVAIDEVCSNLMIHSHSCNNDESIEVRVLNNGDSFVFEIIDTDEIFDIPNYDAPTLDKIIKDKRSGGIGLILVKKIMDEIQIEKNGNANVCRLFKTLGTAV